MNDFNELLDEEGRDEDEEKRNPLLLAWKRERVKENWSKVRNCMRDFIVRNSILSPVLKVRRSE